ncbi:ribbon-helix-helix domain-containing protein [Devosia sp. XJ19-1]|uniref:Ribbon-helix-helix domain-containing protein n=1 Tax=Devosia ureilytica TaxID=2952754 RepID=A0A9Q4ASA7_9HYPH|nr:ribbon-helix-helix domain-containing protein [Devosia ureilytica]MCP8885379.1 ribbon-helix-helix domain-containing protein [Devosia ureilytica]MCP8888945.1 ribbon-helix-helix domain-containing protein [Devosia ureilytica]
MTNTPLSDPITMRLPLDVLKSVETIAAATERSRSWVIVRALRFYLAGEGREILEVAAGLRELEAGQGEDIDDVIADIEKIIRGDAA